MSEALLVLDIVARYASGIAALGAVAESMARIATNMEKIMLELHMLSGWSKEDISAELGVWPGSLSDLLFYYRQWNRFPSEVE